MRYATLCSGVEGFGIGFERVGWQCEIDRFAADVLRFRFPQVTRGRDVYEQSTIDDVCRIAPDVVAFGSPCQDLSIAGRGSGLAGKRSRVFFRCMEIALASRAPIVVWENVFGALSSNHGRDFAAVLAAFTAADFERPPDGWKSGGFAVGPLGSAAWRVLDGRYSGVAQRRRRVFVVGCALQWRDPFEILFDAESVQGDFAPRADSQQDVAYTLGAGADQRRGSGMNPDQLVPVAMATGQAGAETICDLSPTLNCDHEQPIVFAMQDDEVRRLLPIECCRLMGWPDDWNAKGKTEAGDVYVMSDTQRYKQCGNGVIANEAQWIAKRINVVKNGEID